MVCILSLQLFYLPFDFGHLFLKNCRGIPFRVGVRPLDFAGTIQKTKFHNHHFAAVIKSHFNNVSYI